MRKRLAVLALFLAVVVALTPSEAQVVFRPPSSGVALDQTEDMLFSETSLTNTTTGTIEEVLRTVTLPANTLNNYTGFRINAVITGAANANAKTVSLRIGGLAGTLVATRAGDTTSADVYGFQAEFYVTAAGTINGFGHSFQQTGTSNVFMTATVGSLTFSDPLDVTVTGETPTAAGDVTLRAMRLVLLRDD